MPGPRGNTHLDVFAVVVALFTGLRRGFEALAVQAEGSGLFMPANLAPRASMQGLVDTLPSAVTHAAARNHRAQHKGWLPELAGVLLCAGIQQVWHPVEEANNAPAFPV